MHNGIPTPVLCNNVAASRMRAGKIQAVVVGGNRVAANGDMANGVGGACGVAVLAKEHEIIFYESPVVDNRYENGYGQCDSN